MTKDPVAYGNSYSEVYPTTPGTMACLKPATMSLGRLLAVNTKQQLDNYPWNPESAPVELKQRPDAFLPGRYTTICRDPYHTALQRIRDIKRCGGDYIDTIRM